MWCVMAKVFAKSAIRRVVIAVEKAVYYDVYLGLGSAGIIHLAPLSEAAGVMDRGLRDEEAGTKEILGKIEFCLHALDIGPGESSGHDELSYEKGREAFVLNTVSALERINRLRSTISGSLESLGEGIELAGVLNKMGIDPATMKKAGNLKMVIGIAQDTDWPPPSGQAFEVVREGAYVAGAALPSGVQPMLGFLNRYGFTDKTTSLRPDTPEGLTRREKTLRRRLEILDAYKARLRSQSVDELVRFYDSYKRYNEVMKAMHMSLATSRAVIISGWIDLTDRDRLLKMLHEICSGRYVAAVSEEREREAPVRLINTKLFRPFELLVKTMGMPANSEIDPTPLAAVSFVVMFGFMFGDIGQGLVLMLIGVVLRMVAKGDRPEGPAQAGGILIVCGISAAVCGLLFGSIFSNEHVIGALWFHPMTDVMRLFGVTILLGVVIIITGLVINIVNSIMNSDYTEALLDKRGLAVLVCYVAALVFAVRYALTGNVTSWPSLVVFLGIPLSVFMLRGFIGVAFFNADRPESIVEYIIETLLEVLELAMGLLANTVSFIRVGAFALSHTGLGIVTYTLAAIYDPAMKSIGVYLIIILGNIFIIGFEGLVCGIQSMRLEYYEFFSKFFKGDGAAFTPFVLKAKNAGGTG